MTNSNQTTGFRKHLDNAVEPFLPIVGLVKLGLTLTVIVYLLIELTTPGLRFNGEDGYKYRSVETPKWQTQISRNGVGYYAYHTEMIAADRRIVPIDVYLPQHLPQGLPLTIISANFIRTEQMLDWVQPRGNNAIIIYHPPRQERLLAPSYPFWSQITHIRSFTDFWNVLATNPVNKWYSTYRAMHEAPYDISEIVRWAQDTLGVDSNHINLVGMGTGSLTMAAAADRLQTGMGIFPHTLTLIYPPADIHATIYESLFYVPGWIRSPLSYGLTFAYRRLELERHLSRVVGNDNKRLLVVPINAWELSTLATLPAIQSAGQDANVSRIDVNYAMFYDIKNIDTIRNSVLNWLKSERAIGSF